MAKEERIQELIDAARDLFLRFGYKKATLDDLADIVGMTKSSLYHYFKSKEDLFRKVATELFHRDLTLMEQTLANSTTVNEALVKLQKRMRERVAQVDPNATELIGEMNSIYPLVRNSYEKTHAQFIELLKSRLDRAVEEGELRPLETREFAIILLMLLKNSLIFRSKMKAMHEIAVNWEHYVDVLLAPYRLRPVSR
ncbi:MAG: TetR/AcrR family transcriptional regulator [bacterium]